MPDDPATAQRHAPDPGPQRPGFAAVAARARELGPVAGGLAILACTAPAIVGFVVLFGSIVGPERIEGFLESLGVGAAPAAAGLFALLTGVALAPTYALSFSAGAVFGFPIGAGVAMFGVTVGAAIGYVVAALLARRRVMAMIERDERARVIREALLDRPFWTEVFVITLIRIPPNSPFALTNFTLAAVRARPLAYILGTAVGIAPRTLFAVWLGAQAGEISKVKDDKPVALVIGSIAIAIVVFLVLYRLFTRWAREALARQIASNPTPPPAPSTD